MNGLIKDIARVAIFHRAPGVHYQHFVADPRHHAKIVGNHNDGGIKFPLQFI
ncbi:Uncharacterised protein [Shigella sonnei]|nr:Uncharacterised protein [Shigella sonnei]